MSINEKYFNKQPVAQASELFAAGWCNLSCKYCYIPKTDFLKGIHQNIIKRIEDGSLLKDAWDFFGEDMETFSHWGTEPTLTLTKFKPFYDEAFKIFPKLKKIFFSSNFMTNPENIVKFAHEILPQRDDIELGIQISLDGPAWITDDNRTGGSTLKIIQNANDVIKRLDTPIKIAFNVKSTIGINKLRELADFKKVEEYYDFFEETLGLWFESMKGKNMKFGKCVDPTFVVPSPYTQEDGKALSAMYDHQICLQQKTWNNITPPDCHYYGRWMGRLPYYREFFTKQRMFTCSAADSNFAIGDKQGIVHGCHRSFYMNHPEYENECKKWGLDEQTMEGIETERSKDLTKLTIADMNNEAEITKMLYLNRAYHDNVKFRLSTSMALIKELAIIGQVSKVYKDWRWAELFAMFIQNMVCQMDNISTGSCLEINPASYFRLFGNGTFEKIIERTKLINECK